SSHDDPSLAAACRRARRRAGSGVMRPDLDPAGVALVNVLGGVHEEHLGLPSPCTEWTVGQLLAHVDGLTRAFTGAATKDLGPLTDNAPGWPPPAPAAGWVIRIPRQVEALV